MSRHERPFRPDPSKDGPLHPVELPPELAAFLADQGLTALLHGSDAGPLYVVKAPEVELQTLGGPIPIALVHQLYAHPRSPIVRTLLTFHDLPDRPLRLESFVNVGDPDQRDPFAALAEHDEISLLFYDEFLRHRRSKRMTNTAAGFVPTIVGEADRLLATIPPDQRDFDAAKAAVLEATRP
jgi:hypothetical protein